MRDLMVSSPSGYGALLDHVGEMNLPVFSSILPVCAADCSVSSSPLLSFFVMESWPLRTNENVFSLRLPRIIYVHTFLPTLFLSLFNSVLIFASLS